MVSAMDTRTQRAILERRIALLRGHIEDVGASEGFQRELDKAEAQLRELPERKDDQP
jgi:hypothetical protein